MIKGFKVKIHPSKEQIILLQKSFGCRRFAYNWAKSIQDENYKNGGKFISDGDLRKQFTQIKKQEEYKWLYEVNNNVTKQAIKDCCLAYKRMFKGLAKAPRFKSKKKSKPSIYNDVKKIQFNEKQVRVETIGWIDLAEQDRIPFGENISYLNPRISFDGLSYWASVNVEVDDNQVDENKTEPIGLDIGIKKLVVCSNGDEYRRVCTKKETKKLKRLQKRASRLYDKNYKKNLDKSNNLLKLEKLILKQHKRINNLRLNNIHQITNKLVKLNPKAIVIEDLNVSDMMKNKHLAKAIADCSFYEIRRQLEYKCEWNKIELIIANRWYASSKVCSGCNNKKSKLSLSDRVYKCECCGLVIDRDLNASLNLKNLAI